MVMEEIKQATRIQTSVLNKLEKKVLVWLAAKQPSWVTSDLMTGIGFAGSVLIAAGFILSNHGAGWLWLSIAGFFVNWYGDSLDGTIARVRNAQRPVYGYYLDHTMDILNELLMFVGVGLSPWVHLNIALLAFVFYLILTLNVSMNAHLRNEFKLTYAKMGPTELRIIMIIICLLFICIRPLREYTRGISVFGRCYTLTAFDFIGIVICALLGIICFFTIIGDLRYYAKADPPRKNN